MKSISIDKPIDLGQIEEDCRSANEPMFLTSGDHIHLVVMDIDYFEKTTQRYYETLSILEGLKDINEGRVVDAKKL